jgi:hypothetical protein
VLWTARPFVSCVSRFRRSISRRVLDTYSSCQSAGIPSFCVAIARRFVSRCNYEMDNNNLFSVHSIQESRRGPHCGRDKSTYYFCPETLSTLLTCYHLNHFPSMYHPDRQTATSLLCIIFICRR